MGYPVTFKVTTVPQLCPLPLLRYYVTFGSNGSHFFSYSYLAIPRYRTFSVTVTVSITPLASNGVHHCTRTLTGHSTEDFFHLSNILYTFEQFSILCN